VREKIFEILAWHEAEIPRVRSLIAMRRFWSTTLYARLRDEYEATILGKPRPQTLDDARPIVDTLPSLRRWAWLDRHVQDRLWQDVGQMVDQRADALAACLDPLDDDLGSIEIDPNQIYPDYYSQTDFHRQIGGIWKDDRGAAIYAMGARVIHIGKNDNFGLHDAFAKDLSAKIPQRILDLACGFGKTTFSLKKIFPDAVVDGIDLAAPCLRLGNRMANDWGLAINWRQGNIEHLPYEENEFDLITTTMTLHELPLSSIHQVFSEAYRVLKPGGTLVTIENPLMGEPLCDVLTQYHSQIIKEPFHFDFRLADMKDFALEAGFSEVEDRAWFPFGNKAEAHQGLKGWLTPWLWTEANKNE